MDRLKSIQVKIDVNLGSKFQDRFAAKCLIQVLEQWKTYLLQVHKKNKIELKVETNLKVVKQADCP